MVKEGLGQLTGEQQQEAIRGKGTLVEQYARLYAIWEWYRGEDGPGRLLGEEEAEFVYRTTQLYVTSYGFHLRPEEIKDKLGFGWMEHWDEEDRLRLKIGRPKMVGLESRARYLNSVAKGLTPLKLKVR